MPECMHLSYGRDDAMIIALCLHLVVFSPDQPLRAEQALRVTMFGHWMLCVQSLALQG